MTANERHYYQAEIVSVVIVNRNNYYFIRISRFAIFGNAQWWQWREMGGTQVQHNHTENVINTHSLAQHIRANKYPNKHYSLNLYGWGDTR